MKQKYQRNTALVFAGILLFVILATLLVNFRFLERYYIHRQQAALTGAYEEINEALLSDEITSNTFLIRLEKICAASNIEIFAIDSQGRAYLNNTVDESVLKGRLLTHIFADESTSQEAGSPENADEVLAKTDTYELLRTEDDRMHTDYLEMWGILCDGSPFIMRTPLASIHESVKTANRFLMFAAIGAALIGGILVFFLARVTDLRRANEELQKDIARREETERMRSEFLSNVSHDLKTPIAVIQGYAEGLADGVAEDEESRREYAEVICDEAKKMNGMVRRLLELNQLESGTDHLNLTAFDLHELICGVAQAQEVLAKKEGISITCDVASPLPVCADPVLIEEAFTNYLTNAMRHADGQKRILIKGERRDGAAEVSVFNTGETIPENELSRIWEKFYRTDTARNRRKGGNGIGLSIVRAVIEAHKGTYGVRNEEDGVTFYFTLPEEAETGENK